MNDSPDLVHLEVADAIATITLDSPHNRNALSRRLMADLDRRLGEADADPGVRAVLLRSAGRVFCSGADLAEASAGGMEEGAKTLMGLQRRIATLRVPVVVELAGPVRAGGLGLVAAADVVVAARSVSFQLTEVRLGLAPAVISATLLPRLAPRAASDLFLTARAFDAAEAVAIGLVTRTVDDEDLRPAVQAVLGELTLGNAQGLAETKKLLNADLVDRLDRLTAPLARLSADLFASDEARAAMKAFLSRPKG